MTNLKEQTEIRWRDYRIIVDEWNWSTYTAKVVKNGKTKGTEKLHLHGHFTSPVRMINHIAKLETLKQKDTCTLDEFIKEYRKQVEFVMEHIPISD